MIPKPEDMKCPICGGRLYDQGKNRAIAERCSHGDDFKAVIRFYSCGRCGRDIEIIDPIESVRNEYGEYWKNHQDELWQDE